MVKKTSEWYEWDVMHVNRYNYTNINKTNQRKLIWWSQITPHSKFWMRQWKEWNMLWFILQLIHFMAIKYLLILVIDKNPNPNHNLWTVNVKYTIIKLNPYFMVYSIVLKFEKIWLSGTLNIIRKPKKSLFSKRKRAITQER